MTRTHRAIWWTAVFGAFFCFCLVTLATYPEYLKSEMRFAHEPAWWQFQVIAAIGMLLLAAPSYVTFLLDGFFATHEPLRYPIVTALATLEIIAMCVLVYWIARSIGNSRSSESSGLGPNTSLERTREG